MNESPRLCVELNGCIANNLGLLGIPEFGQADQRTEPIQGAIEGLAWLNGPFAFCGEIYVTVQSEGCDFYEAAMSWLDAEHFTLRTGIAEAQIRRLSSAQECAALANELRPTKVVGSRVDELKQFLLADRQLLFDPHGMQLEPYREIRCSVRGRLISSMKTWEEIVRACWHDSF